MASLPRTTAFTALTARRFIHLFCRVVARLVGSCAHLATAPSTCRIFNGTIGLLNEQHRESTAMPSPRWRPGESGNVAGRKPGSRNRLSDEIISSFLRDWRKHGDKALEKVRRTQPAAYCKLAVLLVPKEHKVEHTDTYENLSTEQIEAYIAEIQDRLDRRAAGDQAKVIDGEAVETSAVATTTPLRA